MKRTILAAMISVGLLTTGLAQAGDRGRDLRVEITNLTNGTYFTPLLVAAHGTNSDLFELATPASAHLQAMAEGGDISGLIDDVEFAGGVVEPNPAGGLLAPGATAIASFDVRGRRNTLLSIVAMLLPTNDGFVGLDSFRIPSRRGSYTVYLNGYDAGTEANDEIINGGGMPGVPGVPADPGGSGGSGATGAAFTEHNPRVHIHRGVLGDMDPSGGFSDLDSRVHRWLNPVARVVIHVGGGER